MQKVALITGGARRIGAAIATYLHAQNFRIVIHCHNSFAEACVLRDKFNNERADSAIVVQTAIDSPGLVELLIERSFTWTDRLDILVNNAAIFSKNANDFENMLTTNVKTPYWLSCCAYKYLKKVNGVIINITDTHSRKPLKNYAIYCQTKAALSMQTKALALEFAPDVRVNAVAPGAILWPEGENILSDDKKQFIIASTLLKRHGDPIYIAKAVFALVDNDFITGHEIIVDGGRNL